MDIIVLFLSYVKKWGFLGGEILVYTIILFSFCKQKKKELYKNVLNGLIDLRSHVNEEDKNELHCARKR